MVAALALSSAAAIPTTATATSACNRAEAKDLTLEVYDREFFVDFSFAEKDPVKLVGAPAQCKLSVGRPQEMSASLTQQLSKLGADQRDPSLTIGAEYANKILVKCP